MRCVKRKKRTRRAGFNGDPVWHGCRISAHHALLDKSYEKAAKALDDPEVDREIARAMLPHIERALERIREMIRAGSG